MRPMLAKTYGPKYNRFPSFCQPKLNGVRGLYQSGSFQSRDEKLWKPNVLAHIIEELGVLDLGNLVLDGEFYVHGWRLQRINGAIAVKRNAPVEDTFSVGFHIFDIVDPTKRFSDRWLSIYNSFPALDHVHIVPTTLIHSHSELKKQFEFYVGLGYEGIMLRPDEVYEFGETPHGTEKRSANLWKYKSWEDGEYICTGVTRGEGKAAIGIGALILKVEFAAYTHKFIDDNDSETTEVPGITLLFNVGTGFSDEERIEFMANPPIGKKVRVRYPYLSADGIPQCPSFLAVLD